MGLKTGYCAHNYRPLPVVLTQGVRMIASPTLAGFLTAATEAPHA
jgi:hypothetical protein